MGLPNFCIRKPVTTIMLMSFIVLFGFISLAGLPQELFPPIVYPQLTVVTAYANAAPEEIETLITKPVEEAVGTVSGLRRIKSISREGLSLVMAEFGWNEDMDYNALKVREKVDLIKAGLPREAGEPLVMKYNPFELPIMTLSVTGKRSLASIREVTERVVKDALEKIEGVASAAISGGLQREILVEVDQGRLYAQDVPIMSVVQAISSTNLNYPAGTIKESFYEYLIRTLGEFEHIDEIPEIPIKKFEDERPPEIQDKAISGEGNLVLLKDVANVQDTFKERTSFSRYNGSENIAISIHKQAQANTLQVVNRVRKALKQLKEELPPDINIIIVSDQSKFIKDSINGVRDAAIQGGILAFIVLYLFLRNVKSSIIVTFSMPISIMAVFVAMYFCGISLNMMSLGGLALGIGMLVDNAIVVLENITRHKDLGKSSEQAATDGANEVANAISASTLTTIAVFFPMIFVIGMAGQLFKQLAFTVIFSLVASLLVALTLIPLLAARVKGVKMAGVGDSSGHAPAYLVKFEKFLKLFLKKRKLGYFIIFILFLIAIGIFGTLDKELMPKMDQGQFTIKINMPAGTRLEVTDRVTLRVEEFILSLPDVKDVSTIVGSTRGKDVEDVMQRLGSHQAEITITLNLKRKIKTKELVHYIQQKIKTMDLERGRVEYILSESIFSGAVEKSSPIVIEVKGKKLSIMSKLVNELKQMLDSIKGISSVTTDLPERSPETKIVIDKEKAGLYQLSVVDIAKMVQVALRGYVASSHKEKGQEIDIRVRLRQQDRDNFRKLARVQLSSPSGVQVPLISLVNFIQGRGPSEIKRLDQERTILVSADIFKRALKDVTSDVKTGMKDLDVPSEYTVKLTGESEEMKESFNSLCGALILSVILVYMIMASQFESLWQPFIIMFTFPLSLIGVVFALAITHTSVNVIVILGVIMLGGIVVNNGIVLIDYINVLRAEKTPVFDSVVEASKARLRPILMTAMTTVLGLLPMALAVGEGAELRAPLAISVMGGLFVTTFLSLLVIPAIYLATHEIRMKLFKR